MRNLDYQVAQAIVRSAGTCPGCGDGGCYGEFHCPCEGCACVGDAPTATCAAEHWIGHSTVTGEDLFGGCVFPPDHPGTHRDISGNEWSNPHQPALS